MTGLEKLMKHIEDDAETAAKAVIAQAKLEADEILAAAKAQGDKKSAELSEQSKMDAQACISRAESAAALLQKRNLLDAKQQIIENILIKAKETMINLPDSEYFNIILKMIKKYALAQSGQILFSKKDKVRLPEKFEVAIREVLSGREGAELSLSEQTRDIDGGFILIYGDMEENCSFEALFATSKETLQDKVNAFLFS